MQILFFSQIYIYLFTQIIYKRLLQTVICQFSQTERYRDYLLFYFLDFSENIDENKNILI